MKALLQWGNGTPDAAGKGCKIDFIGELCPEIL
jgi:hypothetical protein